MFCVDLTVERFRWVECQLDALRKYINRAAVRKTLKELPNNLDKTYDGILNSIPDEYSHEAHTALQLLAVARRPLTLAELAEAVVVNLETNTFDTEERMPDPYD